MGMSEIDKVRRTMTNGRKKKKKKKKKAQIIIIIIIIIISFCIILIITKMLTEGICRILHQITPSVRINSWETALNNFLFWKTNNFKLPDSLLYLINTLWIVHEYQVFNSKDAKKRNNK